MTTPNTDIRCDCHNRVKLAEWVDGDIVVAQKKYGEIHKVRIKIDKCTEHKT